MLILSLEISSIDSFTKICPVDSDSNSASVKTLPRFRLRLAHSLKFYTINLAQTSLHLLDYNFLPSVNVIQTRSEYMSNCAINGSCFIYFVETFSKLHLLTYWVNININFGTGLVGWFVIAVNYLFIYDCGSSRIAALLFFYCAIHFQR